jgi:hypothetical protein
LSTCHGRLAGFRKHLRVGGGLEGVLRDETGGLVVAVTVALVALEPRNQHERAIPADDAHDVAQHRLAPPLLERLVEAFREAVVDDRREVLPIQAVVAAGHLQFLGANQSDRVEELGSDRVVA